MPRPASGQVVERKTKRGAVYALRFSAYGERRYVTLGTAEEGWNQRRAEEELENVLADVRRGIWQPARERTPEPTPDPTFHEFASEWFRENKLGWKETTRENYQWQLSRHLLPFFAGHRLSAITVAEVDRYRNAKQQEGRLNAEQINKCITRLGQVLDVAHERELIDRNPVRVNPRRRRIKTHRTAAVFLDSAEQIVAVLDAAGELDAGPTAQTSGRRAFMATLTYAGLRISEACELRRHSLDLAAGRIEVAGTKTEAAAREVGLLPALSGELSEYLAGRPDTDPFEPLFPTAAGTSRDRHNARARVVDPVFRRANELSLERSGRPLPDGLTAHKLRHTYASVRIALGHDLAAIADDLGHANIQVLWRIYRHTMKRSERERERLRELVEGAIEDREWAPTGTSPDRSGSERQLAQQVEAAYPASANGF